MLTHSSAYASRTRISQDQCFLNLARVGSSGCTHTEYLFKDDRSSKKRQWLKTFLFGKMTPSCWNAPLCYIHSDLPPRNLGDEWAKAYWVMRAVEWDHISFVATGHIPPSVGCTSDTTELDIISYYFLDEE